MCMYAVYSVVYCSVKKADPAEVVASEDQQAEENKNGVLSEAQQPKE